MQIQDIYDQYTIPPILQKHMYTVAALGTHIASSVKDSSLRIEKDVITEALLLHDMGNIVKFDLSRPGLLKEDELDYWRNIQAQFVEKYGKGDHDATILVLRELGVSNMIIHFMELSKSIEAALSAIERDMNFAIMFYADFRVGPYGILPLDARIDDLLVRYKDRVEHFWSQEEKAEQMRTTMKKVEAKLQKHCSISVKDIEDADVAFILTALSSYPIGLNQES
ncbi:hypothetical protein KBD09_03015 [Candidatus Woesebacteria bacterium]|nr:hypothetical protein [Candidatus Woesebacteria bacterium]